MLLRATRAARPSARRAAALVALLCTAPHTLAQVGGTPPPGADTAPGSSIGTPHGGSNEVGTGTWGVQLGYYDVSDSGGGNPFVDEDVTVIEPVFYFDYQATKETGYWAMVSYDAVSSASIERVKRFGQQSGASGDYYAGADFGMRHALDENRTLGGHFGASAEYDYMSIGLGGSLAVEAEDRNSSYTVSANAYYDQLDLIRWDGDDEGTDNRVSIATSFDWYQVMTPLWHGQVGLTVSHQSGFLEAPINSVIIEDDALPPNTDVLGSPRGTEADEELPDSRLRTALYGRARRSLGDHRAVEIGGRLYQDDWGIFAFNVEPKWIEELVPDRWLMRLSYRYYDQTEADAYYETLTEDLDERTQDPELAAFSSHTVGVNLEWTPNADVTWDFGVSYMARSDDLDHLFGWVGRQWSF